MQPVLCQADAGQPLYRSRTPTPCPPWTNGSGLRYQSASNATNDDHRRTRRRLRAAGAAPFRDGRHRVPARDAPFSRSSASRRWPAPTRPSSSMRWRRSIDLAPFFDADGERAGGQGLPRRPPGHRNLSGTWPAPSRARSSTPRSPPWCSAMANSISYDQLVQRITGDTLDKSPRFTDWTRRPLSRAQLTYAISDVTHLRDVYRQARRRPREAAAAPTGCARRWRS